jgi:hypothetical protein
MEALQAELKGLNKRSEQLDAQIASVVQSLQRKHSDPAFKERAYVTDEDIKDLDGFSDRSVLSLTPLALFCACCPNPWPCFALVLPKQGQGVGLFSYTLGLVLRLFGRVAWFFPPTLDRMDQTPLEP